MGLERKKTGFIGGSFDPIHLGHITIAQDALELAKLDRVFFVPSGQNPHKEQAPEASQQDRLAMINLALKDYPDIAHTDIELMRSGPSYTVETIMYLKSEFPGDRLFWIMGEDQLPGLSSWREIEYLAEMVEFISLRRPGTPYAEPAADVRNLRLHRYEGHVNSVSSTEIRQRIREGKTVSHFLNSKVHEYITDNELYGA